MRGQAIFVGFLNSFLGLVFIGVGVAASRCDSDSPSCEGASVVVLPFLGLGTVFLATILVLNVVWARRRARTALIRRDGIRIPARMIEDKRVGNTRNNGMVHRKTTWEALLPDRSTRTWTIRTTASFERGALLEAAALGDDCALMLDINRTSVARDARALQESAARAYALVPAELKV